MTKQVVQNGHASYWKIQLQIIAFMRVLKFQSITIFLFSIVLRLVFTSNQVKVGVVSAEL